MTNPIKTSLRSRMLLLFGVLSFGMIVLLILFVTQTSQKFFFESEQTKAELLAQTIAPDLSIALYMNLEENAIEKINQLTMRNDVLQIILSDPKGKVIYVSKQDVDAEELEHAFTATSDLHAPAQYRLLGHVTLLYSGATYQNLLQQNRLFVTILTAFITFVLLVLGFILGKMLNPLHEIANRLNDYRAGDFQNLSCKEREDEIGTITLALEKMDSKILEYNQQQQEIQAMLEEKVREQTQTLHHRLYYDLLTNLPNRTSQIARLQREKDATLMIVNIDGFKQVNDLFGIRAGDSLLLQFAEAIDDYAQKSGFECFRFPSDEFTLYGPLADADAVTERAERLLERIHNTAFEWEGQSFHLGITVGAASDLSDGLIEKADIALKRAKREKQPFRFYTRAISVEHEYYKNMAMAKTIRHAFEHDGFIPYFQPIAVDHDSEIAKFEALIRMRDENGSVLSPYAFLDIAKQMRIYPKLTELMIAKCCRYFADLECTFSINLSYEDIIRPQTLEAIQQNIERYNTGPRMVFEILESESVDNYDAIKTFVNKVKSLGCRFAIDDFGSGYSNLNHILHLDIDYLKIDASLIKQLDSDPISARIVENIVSLAKKMQIKTIAEFVHSEAVCTQAKAMGVDYVQGYYISEPLPDIRHLLSRAEGSSRNGE